MAITPTPNGRYKLVLYVTARRGARRRICRTFDTEREAEREAERLTGRPDDAHGRTVLEAVDRYLEAEGRALAPNTHNGYTSKRRCYLEKTWLGALPLDRCDAAALERFYVEMFAGKHSSGRKLATSTVRGLHRLLSVSFKAAKRRHWIDDNPCRDVEVNGPPPRESAVDDYDLADVARVIDAAYVNTDGTDAPETGDELADLAQAAIATGAREGEMAGLRWRDVDLLAGALTYHGSISKKRYDDGPGLVRKALKSKKGKRLPPRRVAIDEGTADMLRARYQRHVAQAIAAGIDPDDLDRRAVFSLTLEVDFTSPAAIGARWRRAAAKAGLEELRFHDLRHVNASEMTAGGVPVTVATRRGGWRSNRMFHDVYSHHRIDDDDPAVAVLAETWRKIEGHRKRT